MVEIEALHNLKFVSKQAITVIFKEIGLKIVFTTACSMKRSPLRYSKSLENIPHQTACCFQVGVLLVDCQGTGDNQRSDCTIDTLITYISLNISTEQILNGKGNIQSTDMFSLQVRLSYIYFPQDEVSQTILIYLGYFGY